MQARNINEMKMTERDSGRMETKKYEVENKRKYECSARLNDDKNV